ncbi:Large-conductance mechanosensitive channel [Synechococcus sp. MIT S9509]|nr:Large-conductance mechanosensitive channel [Synechococcus sp. MIT S9504]KZR89444.1 Large-conductance mechanosensitive channel [Synechococcus sp. MIT S9509]
MKYLPGPEMFFRRWLREFKEFFFQKGNALNLAIAVVVGTQFQQIVDAISKDLLMPLLNPLVRGGGWQSLAIPYFDGELAIGRILDVLLNSLLVGWALFLIIKVINRSERLATSGVEKLRGLDSSESDA